MRDFWLSGRHASSRCRLAQQSGSGARRRQRCEGAGGRRIRRRAAEAEGQTQVAGGGLPAGRGAVPVHGIPADRREARSDATAGPGPIGSMSSMEVNVDMLEQMDLMDMSDHEALDVFLHSGGEDNSATSPVAGPDSLTTEISLQVPTQVELRDKLSSLSSTCARRDGDEEDDDEEEDEEEEEGGARATTRRRRRKRAPPLVMAPDCGSGTPKV
ncbi:dystrobrevin binding protein 1b isoform X3 [Phyllopteryx taeniolatus]|nr:dystrobrevin binding protein 1b isoform X3 [Phyllopteryx taeniolatus]